MNIKQAKRVVKKLSTGVGVLECTIGGIEYMRTKGVDAPASGIHEVVDAIALLQKQLEGVAAAARKLRVPAKAEKPAA